MARRDRRVHLEPIQGAGRADNADSQPVRLKDSPRPYPREAILAGSAGE